MSYFLYIIEKKPIPFMTPITRTEEMLLLVVCKLQADAFGINIRKEVQMITGKRYSVGGIYVPLDRLVGRGWLTTEEGRSTPARRGRPRRLYKITPNGLAMLRAAREMQEVMWASLPELVLRQLGLT